MTENTPELLECPCCGNTKINRRKYIEKTSNGDIWFACWCDKCELTTPGYKSQKLADDAWNTRVFPKCLREKIEEIKRNNPWNENGDGDLNFGFDVALDRVLSLIPGDK